MNQVISLIRRSVIALLLSLPLHSASWALGLGDIELQSNINQPLKAKILISHWENDELDQLELRLGNKAEYHSVEATYPHEIANLKIKIERSENTAHIVLTSLRPVREPFLDVVIIARWGNGQLRKAYTLLLTPPGGE